MKFYAIRQKSTGLFMPAGRSRGYSHDEPTAGRPPRLFNRHRDAKVALGYWLKGEYHQVDYDVYTGLELPRRDRKAEDMEVVEVVLSFRS